MSRGTAIYAANRLLLCTISMDNPLHPYTSWLHAISLGSHEGHGGSGSLNNRTRKFGSRWSPEALRLVQTRSLGRTSRSHFS